MSDKASNLAATSADWIAEAANPDMVIVLTVTRTAGGQLQLDLATRIAADSDQEILWELSEVIDKTVRATADRLLGSGTTVFDQKNPPPNPLA